MSKHDKQGQEIAVEKFNDVGGVVEKQMGKMNWTHPPARFTL